MLSRESFCCDGIIQIILIVMVFFILVIPDAYAWHIDVPAEGRGISIGNSKHFTGLRLNLSDRDVEEIKGFNFTIGPAQNNSDAEVTGVSLGIYGPKAGNLTGLQLGGIKVEAENDLKGLSFALLGAGAGSDITGISFGSLGAGCGNNMTGISFGGLGAGCGNNMTGVALGGLGVGCGNDLTGIAFGLLGAGAGGDMTGISIGGLGSGCGGDLTGISFGLLGTGAGGDIKGAVISGLGTGCGGDITGLMFALGTVQLKDDGCLSGVTASAYNRIEGTVRGLSIGIVNHAYTLHGIQFGLLNYVRDNPRWRRALPILNWN